MGNDNQQQKCDHFLFILPTMLTIKKLTIQHYINITLSIRGHLPVHRLAPQRITEETGQYADDIVEGLRSSLIQVCTVFLSTLNPTMSEVLGQ